MNEIDKQDCLKKLKPILTKLDRGEGDVEDCLADLVHEYYETFEQRKEELPYWMNLVDEIRADENAHTRILNKLLSYSSGDTYPIFNSFIRQFAPDRKGFESKKSKCEYEFKLNDCFKLDTQIRYPDIYIRPEKFEDSISVIIENKINYAEDREEQVGDYIRGMYRHRHNDQESEEEDENCYAFYLVSDYLSMKIGGNDHDGKGRQKVGNNILELIPDKNYILLSYKEDILPWLKEVVSFPLKEKYLKMNVALYIQYLEDRFGLRRDINSLKIEILKDMKMAELDFVEWKTFKDHVSSFKEDILRSKYRLVSFYKTLGKKEPADHYLHEDDEKKAKEGSEFIKIKISPAELNKNGMNLVHLHN